MMVRNEGLQQGVLLQLKILYNSVLHVWTCTDMHKTKVISDIASLIESDE